MIIKNYIRPIISQRMLKTRSLKNSIQVCKLYGVEDKHLKCPVCGRYTLGQDWICNCGWQQDFLLKSDDEYSDSNYCSVNEYKLICKK